MKLSHKTVISLVNISIIFTLICAYALLVCVMSIPFGILICSFVSALHHRLPGIFTSQISFFLSCVIGAALSFILVGIGAYHIYKEETLAII